MFPSRVGTYNDDDLIGTDATTAVSNFDQSHPLYRAIGDLARLTQRHPALRDGAQIDRWSSWSAGIYACSRVDRRQQREYLVAVNNSESAQTANVPTYMSRAWFERVYGGGERRLKTGSDKRLQVTVPALSAVVYEATQRLERSRHAPPVGLKAFGTLRDRAEVGADVGGDGFAEVTSLARTGHGGFKPIGTDDNAPYRSVKRRRLDADRQGRLIAGLHGLRRHERPGRGYGRPLQGRPGVRAGPHGGGRSANGLGLRGAGRLRDGPLPAAGRRLRHLGPAPVRRRHHRQCGDRLGQSAPARRHRRLRRLLPGSR